MSRTRYYVLHRGVRKGPYSSDRLYGKISDGIFSNNTLACEHSLLNQDPNAPWFPLSKILGYISPESSKRKRRRELVTRTKIVPAAGVGDAPVNTGAILVGLAGTAITLYFLVFFGAPISTAAELGAESAELSREVLIQRGTRIVGIFGGVTMIVVGAICTLPGSTKD